MSLSVHNLQQLTTVSTPDSRDGCLLLTFKPSRPCVKLTIQLACYLTIQVLGWPWNLAPALCSVGSHATKSVMDIASRQVQIGSYPIVFHESPFRLGNLWILLPDARRSLKFCSHTGKSRSVVISR